MTSREGNRCKNRKRQPGKISDCKVQKQIEDKVNQSTHSTRSK